MAETDTGVYTLNKKTGKYYPEVKPVEVDGQRAIRVEFYRKELRKIIKGLFRLEMPDEWELDYILNAIIERGFIIISASPAGILPITGSLTGINYINYPTTAVLTAPKIGNWRNKIGVNCEIIFLDRIRPTYFYNFMELIDLTAEKLASVDGGIDVNVMNTKMSYFAEAESKTQAEEIAEVVNKATNGAPLVVTREGTITSSGLNLIFGNVKNNFVADVLYDVKHEIINDFLTSVGVNNTGIDKRERAIVAEVASNNMEIDVNVSHWKTNLRRQCERTNRIFPRLNFNIEMKYDPMEIANMASNLAGAEPTQSKGGDDK